MKRVEPQRSNQVEVLQVDHQHADNHNDMCLILVCAAGNLNIVMFCISVIMSERNTQS